MIESWGSFLFLYALIAAVPAIVLAVRGFGWRWRFFAASLLLSWTGGAWVVMLWIAVLQKPSGVALYMGEQRRGRPPAEAALPDWRELLATVFATVLERTGIRRPRRGRR